MQTQLYVSNQGGMDVSHNGMTVSLTAFAAVQPCQTYHLRIAIADVFDGQYDSGVFLEAKSFSANIGKLSYTGPVDAPTNKPFIIEGCTAGSINMSVPTVRQLPTGFTLLTAGNAINGVDVASMPNTVTIPANTASVSIPIMALVDAPNENTESITVYLVNACNPSIFLDSVTVSIKDYDTLRISPNSPAFACGPGIPFQLNVLGSYSQYAWDANTTLNATNIATPTATNTIFPATYYCTASNGTCRARDSITLFSKNIVSQSTTNVNCKNGVTGSISIVPGPSFVRPLQFSLNGGTNQLDSNFYNLPVGN